MKTYRPAFFLLLALGAGVLSGCSSLPTPSAADASDTLALIDYHDRLTGLGGTDLKNELAAANTAYEQQPTAFNRLRLALVLTLPQAAWHDDQRAISLLSGIDGQITPSMRKLASLLQRNVAERLRLKDDLRKRDLSLRDEQKRSAELQQKLDALRELDRKSRRPVRLENQQ